MDAVGHGDDLLVSHALPGVVGGNAVELADGIGRIGEAQRHRRHVELVCVPIHAAAQLQDAVYRHAAGSLAAVAVVERSRDAPHQPRFEALVACRDRGVDRENAV